MSKAKRNKTTKSLKALVTLEDLGVRPGHRGIWIGKEKIINDEGEIVRFGMTGYIFAWQDNEGRFGTVFHPDGTPTLVPITDKEDMYTRGGECVT